MSLGTAGTSARATRCSLVQKAWSLGYQIVASGQFSGWPPPAYTERGFKEKEIMLMSTAAVSAPAASRVIHFDEPTFHQNFNHKWFTLEIPSPETRCSAWSD
jgi:hypothetical protein